MARAPRRNHGTAHLYLKHGSYYGRWRAADGRWLNRKVGPARTPSEADGLTRSQAERAFRRLQDAEERRPAPAAAQRRITVNDAAESLRQRITLEGARKSYLQNLETMQRVHIAPRLGDRPLTKVKTEHIEDPAMAMLEAGKSPRRSATPCPFST